jgi:hypothetical protein
MSICLNTIPLKKGDTVSLRGTYDLTKHDLWVTVSGGNLLNFTVSLIALDVNQRTALVVEPKALLVSGFVYHLPFSKFS